MSIVARHVIRKMRGSSQAHLMMGSDANLWVVKLQNNPQHLNVLANEFIVTGLAEAIGLSVPTTDSIVIAPLLAENDSTLGCKSADGGWKRCVSGRHFGSRHVGKTPGDTVDYLPNSLLAGVINLREFAGILALDKWTCNCDGRQAVFTKDTGSKRYRAAFIDHGCCFDTGTWTFPDAPLRALYGQKSVYGTVTEWASFSPWLERIERMDPEVVYQIARSVPPEWYVRQSGALDRLTTRLLERRLIVRDLISEARRVAPEHFPHWSAKSFANVASMYAPALRVLA